MPVTKDQAIKLAELACDIRPHGAPRWEPPGVIAAIGKVNQLALADVGMAVMRAAADRTLQTPGPIGNTQSPCWTERPAEKTAPRNPSPRNACWNCGRVLSATCCDSPARRPEQGADPKPWVDQIRQEIRR